MPTLFLLVQLVVSCLMLTLGAHLSIKNLELLSKRIKLPLFSLSFILFGLLTTLPEISVGTLAVIDSKPELFTGNLLGASLLLCFVVVPLFGLANGGVPIPHTLSTAKLLTSILCIALPFFLILDGTISSGESIVMISTYFTTAGLFFNTSSASAQKSSSTTKAPQLALTWLNILLGLAILLLAAKLLTAAALEISKLLSISTLATSFLVVSIGTNMPEISVAFYTLFTGRKPDLALAGYLGSAVANTGLFGFLSLASGPPLLILDKNITPLLLSCFCFLAFSIFSYSKQKISRQECLLLLCMYLLIITFELVSLSLVPSD